MLRDELYMGSYFYCATFWMPVPLNKIEITGEDYV